MQNYKIKTRAELLEICSNFNIKCVSKKSKDDIIILVERHNSNSKLKLVEDKNKNKNKNKNKIVLQELLKIVKKDTIRKVCKNCHELNHYITSINCKLNIEKNNKLRTKIMNYILDQDCLSYKTLDEHLIELSILLNISENLCKTLYGEIPLEIMFNRTANIELYINELFTKELSCYDCNKTIHEVQLKTNRIWKGNKLCDACWCKYSDKRTELWNNVEKYKQLVCYICNNTRNSKDERYHYDHLNMFNKCDSICSLINNGIDIKEILNEVDECQVLCIRCHHIVTNIEQRLGFSRLKQQLTRRINALEITQEEYDIKTKDYQILYSNKMLNVYEELANLFRRKV